MAESELRSQTTIHDLPDNVLGHIVMLCGDSDAFRRALLSRRWRSLWKLGNVLSFEQDEDQDVDNWISYISRFLIYRGHADLSSFNLQFHYSEDLVDNYWVQIDSFIHYAINHNSERLAVKFLSDRRLNDSSYEFPMYKLLTSSVKYLQLRLCNLTRPIGISDEIHFKGLQSVRLDQVKFSDYVMCSLIQGCACLKVLKLFWCVGIGNIRIAANFLEELTVDSFSCDNGSLEIHAPEVSRLQISNIWVPNYIIHAPKLGRIYVSHPPDASDDVISCCGKQLEFVKK